jgi:hypothetical protein
MLFESTEELILHYPFEKNIEYSSMLTNPNIKSINIIIRNYKKDDSNNYINNNETRQLDKLIESIVDNVNDTKNKINICITVTKLTNYCETNYDLFFYFMQFIHALIIRPSVILYYDPFDYRIRTGLPERPTFESYDVIKKILEKILVNKLEFGIFGPECANMMNSHVDCLIYSSVNELIMINSNGNIHDPESFYNFLNKFPNFNKT